SEFAAVFAASVFGLGTPAWCYATLLWGHALTTACLLTAFAAAVALRRPLNPRRDSALALAIGVAGGWAMITEYTAAVPAAIIAWLALKHVGTDTVRRVRVLAVISISGLSCASALPLYNYLAFGSPLTLGYSTVPTHEGMRQGFMGVTYPKVGVLAELLV